MQTQTTPTAFSGDIPKFYDSFLGPMFFEPFALDLAGRIAKLDPDKVLELASGTGRLTKLLPAVLDDNALIIASDINPAMVKYGRSKVNDDNVAWREIDAVSLPFDNASFDCVIVQFGVMFYSDRIKAYREALRVLKPGGKLVFTCWDEIGFNPMPKITNDVLRHFFPANTPAFYSIPFSYFDRGQIIDNLSDAGFQNISLETVRLNGYSNTAADAAMGLIHGTPTVTAINERDPEKLPLVIEMLQSEITKQFGYTSLKVPLQAILVTATKN